jgi:hypothetical protein
MPGDLNDAVAELDDAVKAIDRIPTISAVLDRSVIFKFWNRMKERGHFRLT